jgi:hypothetical protein
LDTQSRLLILLNLALLAPCADARRPLLLLRRGAASIAARRTVATIAVTFKLDTLGGVPVPPVVVIFLGRPRPGARVRRARPLIAVGQFVDIAL